MMEQNILHHRGMEHKEKEETLNKKLEPQSYQMVPKKCSWSVAATTTENIFGDHKKPS